MQKKYPKFFSTLRIALTVFFVGIVGTIAGILGGLISPQVFLPEDIIQLRPIVFENKVASRVAEKETDLSDIVRSVAPSMGELYRASSKNSLKDFATDFSPFGKDFLGYALVGTADGWMLLPPALAHIRIGDIRFVDNEKRIFHFESTLSDPATGLQYAKVALPVDTALKPIQIDISTDIGASKQIYGLTDTRTAIPFNLTPLGYSSFQTLTDAVQHSSVLKKRFNATQVFPLEGLPFVTEKKEVIGLATGNGIIPMAYVQDMLTRVLRSKKVQRPTLSLQYIDLSLFPLAVSMPQRGLVKNGAYVIVQKRVLLLQGQKRTLSLIQGDIITRINNEVLDAQKNLSEMIQQYAKGDTITLEYIHGNEKKNASVTLQ